MVEKCTEERRALINSTENSVKPPEEDEGEELDNEEALSFCDLPLINQSGKDNEKQSTNSLRATEIQDDFDFCSLSKESQMCSADEVFYQGQILPLSSQKGFLQYYAARNFTRSISRSESMDHYSSSGLVSSRSSSASSGGGTSNDPKLPRRNQFPSHTSPSPRMRFSSSRQGVDRISNKSSAWNIFRLGLITNPHEISFQDLKTRCQSRNFRSHNSTSCGSRGKRKTKQKALLGACTCSSGAVDTVPSKVAIIKRSASDGENLLAMKSPRKGWSDHRTFEWLKQLSIEAAADEP
ncbi:hypothetical protein CDL12_19525 [Handroanthus impetiginosus]|uniref:Uncharacterized protein n=1 Tax=Handroanthus impetiginosus TaxID=429701 RepID=A0A2G9GRI1_9LAMI|nr:hypothetical protein CDL12_19525 [Handroanthus impetiginosus]